MDAKLRMILIPVGRKHHAKIDDGDIRIVNRHRWHVIKSRTTKVLYAARFWYGKNRKHHSQLMHNLILGYKGVDHINGDGLDCRRSNMRRANKSQNAANSGKHKDNTSGFRGVYLDKRDGKWYSQIMKNGKTFNLGRYASPEEASAVYNQAAKKLFGVYARTEESCH